MNNVLVNLLKLQKIDSRLVFFEELEKELPIKTIKAREQLTNAEEKVEKSDKKLENLKKIHRELEVNLLDFEEKIKANQERQLKATNNEEYRALLKEAEFLKNEVTSNEDEMLKTLEDTDKCKVILEEEKKELTKTNKEYEDQVKDFKQVLDHGQAENKTLKLTKKELIAVIPVDKLSIYNNIFSTRAGKAVAAVKDGLCLACHLSIPPQSFNDLQRNDRVIQCSNCNRILYWEDHPDFNKNVENEEDNTAEND